MLDVCDLPVSLCVAPTGDADVLDCDYESLAWTAHLVSQFPCRIAVKHERAQWLDALREYDPQDVDAVDLLTACLTLVLHPVVQVTCDQTI